MNHIHIMKCLFLTISTAKMDGHIFMTIKYCASEIEMMTHPAFRNYTKTLGLSFQVKGDFQGGQQVAYQCNWLGCHSVFTHHQDLLSHQNFNNHLDRECAVCMKIFADVTKLKRHIKTVHMDTTYQCHLCKNKCFNRPDNLKRHQLTSHGMYSCRYCKGAFFDPQSFKAHEISCNK